MLAHAPLAIPQGTQLRGPAGSLRCSICRGPAELASLRQSSGLFPPALRYSPAQMGEGAVQLASYRHPLGCACVMNARKPAQRLRPNPQIR